jgi:hypothetical protein
MGAKQYPEKDVRPTRMKTRRLKVGVSVKNDMERLR